MRLFVYWDDDEVFFKQVHVFRPGGDACVSLLRGCQLWILLLGHRCESFVEELAEDVRLVTLIFRQQLQMNILQIEIDDHVVEIVVGAETKVVVCVDRKAASSWRINQKFSAIHFLNSENESKELKSRIDVDLLETHVDPSAVLFGVAAGVAPPTL